MAFLTTCGILLAMIGYYLFVVPEATRTARDAPSAEGIAVQLLAHQKASVDWCLRTGCPDGAVPAEGLTLPPGYAAAAWMKSVAQGGRVTTFVSGLDLDGLAVAAALGDLTAGGPAAGLTAADGTLMTRDLAGGRAGVAVVSGVPAGVPAVSQQVR